MQAAQIPSHGPPSVLEVVDLPQPEPGPGEVLVRVLAASVNHLDLWVRRGMPGLEIPLPRIPGSDGTGVIEALGAGLSERPGLEIGQRVVIQPGMSSGKSPHDLAGQDHLADDYGIRGEHADGIHRELLALEPRYIFPLPEAVDPVAGAAVPLAFMTAWEMLMGRAELAAGETVLVLGGTSGVGSAAIQLAREAGARVIATAGTEAKRELCRELGAEEVLDHYDPDWGRMVKSSTGGRGVEVVIEHVGPATWETSLRVLARRGRLVTCGGTTGPTVPLTLPHLFIKNQSIHGSTMGPASCLPGIFEQVAAGRLRPVLDRALPLARIQEAHGLLEAGSVLGKIVLVPAS
ncbi:MAG: zinc-binding dehydrogenase [Planctomycetota bacterium]|jgi:NADPH:quinone reductase-like Zn-dependent oxidoreductase|nr:alcohol dehydrogenase [Planctomycetota bacterium]MDP6369322.1 zinc-binding dehydrogenase [Planctomycetota bacterium]